MIRRRRGLMVGYPLRWRAAGALVTLTCALTLAACDDEPVGPVCTTEAVFGINLTVQDGSGGPAAEGATGVAVDGAWTDTLVVLSPYDMAGAVERPGTYEITVSKFGYMTWTATNVTVRAGECHVIPVSLQANLIPVP